MVDHRPEVEAIAIASGRILRTGEKAYVLETATVETLFVDLGGNTLMPAFIDAHGHFMNALQVVTWANVSGKPVGPVGSIADIIDVLKAHVERRKLGPGEWIVGYGYDRTTLSDQRELTRDDLDPHFPDNPVMLIHVSNHGAVLNSAAFGAFEIDANTPTPAGGVILRKPGSEEPAGLIMETAFLPVFGNMPQPTEQELLDTFPAAQEIYASKGITTVQEGATHAKDLALLRTAANQDLLYLDLVSLPLIFEVPAMLREYFPDSSGNGTVVPDAATEHFGAYRNRLKLGGVKFLNDGSPQGKTAFWSKPLLTPGPDGQQNWRGEPTVPPELLNKAVKEIAGKQIQLWCHCNGDAAIDMLLDAVAEAGITASDDRRDVVIHSQFVRDDQLDAYLKHGISPSFFTVHAFFWGNLHIENLGEERGSRLSPMRSAIDRGIRCSNHNDFSVTPVEPMRMLWSAVTRTAREGNVIGPQERISIWEALKAITIDAAWQYHEEDHKGTIEAGKLADLVILDKNPLTVPNDELLSITVMETLKEGQTVYRNAG